MIKHGLQPIQLDRRDYSYHRTFGSTTKPLPDEINLDKGLWMPNQNEQNGTFGIPEMPYGCTNYTTCAVCSDEDGVLYNPGFQESITHANARHGADVRESLKTSVDYGVQALGETPDQAKNHKRSAFFRVGQNPDFFDGVRTVMSDSIRPISAGGPWFREWETPDANGKILPSGIAPDFNYDGNGGHYSWHNFEINGCTTKNTKGELIRNGEVFLKVKSWQGDQYGDKGWLYWSKGLTNMYFGIQYTGMFTVAKATPAQIKTVGETYLFLKNLVYGDSHPDVAELQKALQSLGYTIVHAVTLYFGGETKTALAAFQSHYGIADDGSHFGPLTRAKLNSILNPDQTLFGQLITLVRSYFGI